MPKEKMNIEPNEDDIMLSKRAIHLFDGNGLSMIQSAALLAKEIAAYRIKLIQDYEEVLADHRRLVRELDVIWNGVLCAAKQASLCDIVHQIAMDLEEGELMPCCRTLPELKYASGKEYSGSVRYECPVCHRTTITCYSTLGDSVKMAREAWNEAVRVR